MKKIEGSFECKCEDSGAVKGTFSGGIKSSCCKWCITCILILITLAVYGALFASGRLDIDEGVSIVAICGITLIDIVYIICKTIITINERNFEAKSASDEKIAEHLLKAYEKCFAHKESSQNSGDTSASKPSAKANTSVSTSSDSAKTYNVTITEIK